MRFGAETKRWSTCHLGSYTMVMLVELTGNSLPVECTAGETNSDVEFVPTCLALNLHHLEKVHASYTLMSIKVVMTSIH